MILIWFENELDIDEVFGLRFFEKWFGKDFEFDFEKLDVYQGFKKRLILFTKIILWLAKIMKIK